MYLATEDRVAVSVVVEWPMYRHLEEQFPLFQVAEGRRVPLLVEAPWLTQARVLVVLEALEAVDPLSDQKMLGLAGQ